MTRIHYFSVSICWLMLTAFVAPLACHSECRAAEDPPESVIDASFARLAEPKMADALKLSDEQRSKVAQLLTARAESISKAAIPERAQVIALNEKELSSLLTDEQRAQFTKEIASVRLRFNFRFQKWADVLEWYAKQANLSLILDAPPPGTFNYSDSKTYTPVEAMDLLNSVLSTKGFTLIRRGGMLLVIDVQDGIPDGLIPRVSVEDLEKRGKFEMVSVLFPLANHDPQAIKAEITPLQGPFGKSILLPKTGQLLVTDTAGIVRAINDVISSIPKPSSSAPAPAPLYGVYPLKGADPKVAEEVLSKMFPGAKIAADAKAEQLNAYATPNEQAAIKAIVDQMLAQNPPDKKPVLEVYPVGDHELSQLTASLQLVAPQARITSNPRERQLAIYASPQDHANLKAALEKLSISGPVSTTRQMEVYRLSKADPSSAVTLLQNLLPQVKLTVDTQTRRLVAIASPEDHKAIKAILDQIQSSEPGPDTQVLQFYPLEHLLPANSISTLMSLAPKAQIVSNNDAKQLQVLASPADQILIKENLETLMKGVPAPEQRQIIVYRTTSQQRTKFMTILPSLTTDFPDLKAVPDTESNELAIWAKPAQHEIVKRLIDSLATDLPGTEKPQLISHPLRLADPTTALTVLKSLAPEAKISVDSQNRNLVAIATTEQHAAIKSSLEKLQPGQLGPDAPLLRFYPLDQPLPAATISSFVKLVPKATVTADTEGKWLQVVATSDDQALIKNHLEELLKDLPAAEKRKLVVHQVTPSQRSRFQTLMPSLVTDLPDVRIIAESGSSELAIWAKPSQQIILKDVLEELKREIPESEKNRLVSYPLKYADPTIASAVLQNQFPGTKINVDLNTNRLLIWARPADHPAIKQAVEELDGESLSERKDQVHVYPVPDIDPDAAITMLSGILPKAKFVKDPKARTIVAWAKKADHETIEKSLATMRASVTGAQKPHLKIYPAGKINAANMIDVLRITFPNARLAVDAKTGGLAALGTATEQEEIQSAIDQMLSQAIGETGRFVTYRLFKTERETATAILTQAVPESRITSGKDPTQLMAWARPADHTIIARIIDELESEAVANKGFELKVYTLKSALASTIMPVIGRAVPKAMVNPSGDPHRLVIFALPPDHALVAQIVKQFDAEHLNELQIEFYDLQNVDSDAATRVVQTILQKQGTTGATVTPITGTSQLYVEARPEQHEQIRSALKQLKPIESGFEVFQMETVDAFAADSLIRRMFAGMKTPPPVVEADASTQKLYVRGSSDQINRIREMLEKMGEGSVAVAQKGGNRRVRVIPFGGDSAAALKEIQQIWPQFRTNELRVVPPPGPNSNLLIPSQPENQESQKPTLRKPATKKDQDDIHKDGADQSRNDQPSTGSATAIRESSTGESDLGQNKPKRMQVTSVALRQNQDPTAKPDSESAPPVVVMPRDGSITILSDDVDALEQLDKLLRAVSLPTEAGGRAFAVYSLKFAGATSLAETIRQSLRLQSGGANSRTGASAPTVVADERLNVIIVHANRNDRLAIEKLIETLDSSEIPESMSSNKPRRVAVKHGSAIQIETILRLVYKSQLTTGGGRKEIPIPSGLPPEFAATLQQINAASTGPLLSLSVDEVSNSIVIMAPKSLTDQVAKLIEELDQAAYDENAQGMNIVPTQRMSSQRAQKILSQLLDKTKRGRRP